MQRIWLSHFLSLSLGIRELKNVVMKPLTDRENLLKVIEKLNELNVKEVSVNDPGCGCCDLSVEWEDRGKLGNMGNWWDDDVVKAQKIKDIINEAILKMQIQ